MNKGYVTITYNAAAWKTPCSNPQEGGTVASIINIDGVNRTYTELGTGDFPYFGNSHVLMGTFLLTPGKHTIKVLHRTDTCGQAHLKNRSMIVMVHGDGG